MILTSSIPTDWPTFGTTLLSSILAAVATLLAVVYSNKKTRNQLLEEQQKAGLTSDVGNTKEFEN
jgi:hypothetical protein